MRDNGSPRLGGGIGKRQWVSRTKWGEMDERQWISMARWGGGGGGEGEKQWVSKARKGDNSKIQTFWPLPFISGQCRFEIRHEINFQNLKKQWISKTRWGVGETTMHLQG